ncbi:hypothetical protein F5880DRAFT_1508952 [Lentinula raphanica]|nr:hypothetical protein F5880DRAFT_1508952 [Lentinula raphanica]
MRFLYFSLLFPTSIFATPVVSNYNWAAVPATTNREYTSYLSPFGTSSPATLEFHDYSVELELCTPYGQEVDLSEEFAGKIRNAAEILLPWVFPILRHAKYDRDSPFDSRNLPAKNMVFEVTKLTLLANGGTTSDLDGKDYRLNIKFKGLNSRKYRGHNDHSLYLSKKVFDGVATTTPMGLEDAITLTGRGEYSTGPHPVTFVEFKNEELHILSADPKGVAFVLPQVPIWQPNTQEITQKGKVFFFQGQSQATMEIGRGRRG